MRKLIVQQLMTVDGFLSGPGDELDFMESVPDFSELDRHNLAVLEEVDEVFLGRRTYELFAAYWPTADHEVVAHAVNTLPKTVFSPTLKSVAWGTWDTVRLHGGDAAEEVARMKRQPGGSIMLWGSITLARSLIRNGLVDEFQFHVLPIAIGRGVGLFGRESGHVALSLTGVKRLAGGIAVLTYVPRAPDGMP